MKLKFTVLSNVAGCNSVDIRVGGIRLIFLRRSGEAYSFFEKVFGICKKCDIVSHFFCYVIMIKFNFEGLYDCSGLETKEINIEKRIFAFIRHYFRENGKML